MGAWMRAMAGPAVALAGGSSDGLDDPVVVRAYLGQVMGAHALGFDAFADAPAVGRRLMTLAGGRLLALHLHAAPDEADATVPFSRTGFARAFGLSRPHVVDLLREAGGARMAATGAGRPRRRGRLPRGGPPVARDAPGAGAHCPGRAAGPPARGGGLPADLIDFQRRRGPGGGVIVLPRRGRVSAGPVWGRYENVGIDDRRRRRSGRGRPRPDGDLLVRGDASGRALHRGLHPFRFRYDSGNLGARDADTDEHLFWTRPSQSPGGV